jgi:hypothetical protein
VTAIRSGNLKVALRETEAHLQSAYERLAPAYANAASEQASDT